MAQVAGVSAFPDGDNLFHWLGTIHGPAGTPYEGHAYRIKMAFPADYPFSSPSIVFDTPIFHPNVDPSGAICLDILKVAAGLASCAISPAGQVVARLQRADDPHLAPEPPRRYSAPPLPSHHDPRA